MIIFGMELALDWAISYLRVSSAQQTLEQGGMGIDRQRDAFTDFIATHDIQEDAHFRPVDEGRSASKNKHVNGGALGLFLADIHRVKPNSALVIESFSRLTRLPIDEALALFFQIVTKGGVALVTLQDRRIYTRASLRSDKGQIYMIAASMQASRDLAENVSYYSTKSWKTRRGSVKNNLPSWIVRDGDELIADPVRSPVMQRAWAMGLTMSVNKVIQQFNAENVPTLTGAPMWSPGGLIRIFRGRQVRGEQEIGHYIDGKRVVEKGQLIQAYQAIISEQDWQLMQSRLDGRKIGIATGRNVTRMTNIFGNLAVCKCGQRMRIHRRGSRGQYLYLGCSGTHLGGCDNTKFYRLDKLEQIVLPRMVTAELDTEPAEDPSERLTIEIAAAKNDVATITRAYERSMMRTGELAEQTQAKLEADHQAKTTEVTKLERQLAALSTEPVAEVQKMIGRVLGAALNGDVTARNKIAASLPEVINTLTFHKDGNIRVRSKNSRIGWTITL